MALARHERDAQLVATWRRGRVRVPVQMDEAPAGSSSKSRSRMAQASSSREDEERATIKFMNHAQKIFDLFKPRAQWFNDVVVRSRLGGLCMTGYSTISHGMQGAFVERWHKETYSFHFPVRELTITLLDVACLLHLPIKGRLLDHSRIQRVKAIELMVDYLGMEPNMADYECKATSGAHIRFSNLKELYENHLVAAAESKQEGDRIFTEYHHGCALRCWFMFLVGSALFMDKSVTYADMTYLRYFIDLTTVHEWNWGAASMGWII
ncbi:protein MAIN-LIKE 1-like [Vicia villosa]|uniref:protein MAIN-LIKE 1-like n=1 Tax=Vicia villosa TaxID=3911 RepID=UPI00273B2711|nr:protein MAIN-LIKE 1-like [Vicia villosa]